MSSVVRTDDLPAAERFEFWRQVTYRTWVPVECYSKFHVDFWAQLRSSGLGAVRISLMTAKPFMVYRTPKLISRSDPDLLKIVMPLGGLGSCMVAQNRREANLAPAEFAVYDTRRPYQSGAVEMDRRGVGQLLILLFPRALLPLPPRQVEQLAAVRMGAGQGIGALTSRFLVDLARNIDQCSPAQAARLATAALEVLATRLAHELDGDHWVPPETHKRALLVRVHAFIQQHLGDGELSPGMIAAAHGISIRYLHKLFEAEGQSVGGWIRQHRLDRCRQDLRNPALHTRPVSAIAARWGFASAAHFSRVFRDAHGIPPAEYRLLAIRPGGSDPR